MKLSHILAGASTIALLAGSSMADEIRVLNWQGYGTDLDWAIAEFAEETGNTVVHDYFNSEQEALTKLRTNPDAYDVILINSSFTKNVVTEKLLAPIDPAKLSNFPDIAPNMANSPDLNFDSQLYGVPWAWGLTAFAVNSNVVKEVPTSIDILWDPEMSGRVSIRDDAVEAIQIGALATGQNINDIKDLDAVEAKLKALLPQIRTYWGSENDWNQFMAAGDMDVASYWSGSASRSIAAGMPIAFVVPQEGAIGWLDGLSISAASKHSDAAYAFINYMISPDFYVRWAEDGAPASANAVAAAALPEEAFNRRVLGDPAIVARVQFMRPIADETREKYLEIWQGLKAAQ